MSEDDDAKTYDPSLELTLEVSVPESTKPTRHSSGRGDRLPWPVWAVRMLIALLRKIRETAELLNANPEVGDD